MYPSTLQVRSEPQEGVTTPVFILEPVVLVANTSCHNKELLKAAGVDDSSQILSYSFQRLSETPSKWLLFRNFVLTPLAHSTLNILIGFGLDYIKSFQ